MSNGHAPMYPRYTTPAPERTLAYYNGAGDIIDEHHNRYPVGDDLSTLRDILWTHNLLVFTDTFACFPHLYAMIAETRYNKAREARRGCDVHCSPKGKVIGVQLHGDHNSTRWISNASTWGYPAGPDLLRILRTLYTHCAVGSPSTPGGLGQAVMRTTFGQHHLRHHTRPQGGALQQLRAYGVGGRVDTPGLGQTFDRLLELDLKGAYSAHFGTQPTGTAVGIAADLARFPARNYGVDPDFCTWFGACEVQLCHPLRLGPFPLRAADDALTYPDQSGTYRAWLWREQADDISLLGGQVRLLHGRGWRELTEDTQHYCAVMEQLRREAPNKVQADLIKLATVAGIGRHGMGSLMYRLVPASARAEGDIPMGEKGTFYDVYVHPEPDPEHTNMLHWNNYTVMQCSRTLFWKAYHYARLGWLVATNFDAIYLKQWGYEEEFELPKKGSPEDRDAPSGTWRWRKLYRNTESDLPSIPRPRWINMLDEEGNLYLRTPGHAQEGPTEREAA